MQKSLQYVFFNSQLCLLLLGGMYLNQFRMQNMCTRAITTTREMGRSKNSSTSTVFMSVDHHHTTCMVVTSEGHPVKLTLAADQRHLHTLRMESRHKLHKAETLKTCQQCDAMHTACTENAKSVPTLVTKSTQTVFTSTKSHWQQCHLQSVLSASMRMQCNARFKLTRRRAL